MSTKTDVHDSKQYLFFSARRLKNKAVHTLAGLLRGVTADETITREEFEEIAYWLEVNAEFCQTAPLDAVANHLRDILADGRVDAEELEDLKWLAEHLTERAELDDLVKDNLQELFGILYGIIADNRLADRELTALAAWLEKSTFLERFYPYDELCTLVSSILADGVISESERERFMAFIAQFVDFSQTATLDAQHYRALQEKYSLSGICVANPEVEVAAHNFVLTGEFESGKRSAIEARISAAGGLIKGNVSKKTHYLVVGNLGNPCWAFSTYGRKVEAALELRKAGVPVLIINERDLIAALPT